MSIDFDSAALQTQHEEEEYDHEDYAREQELHKLLTDLPDDMLDDSRDSSSPELEFSACSNKNNTNSPQTAWTQPWPNNPKPVSHEQHFEANYTQGSHGDYTYDDGAGQINGEHLQNHPHPHTWSQQQQQQDDPQFSQADYTYTSMDGDKSAENNDFSADFTQGSNPHVEYNGEGHRNTQGHGDHNGRNQFQPAAVNQYQVTFNPQQPKMFNAPAGHQGDGFDPLQREFLDSTQQTADREQLAQLQILNKAQHRQIEDLEQKLEDLRRNMRYVEHQFAIVKDEKEGLTASLKESRRSLEEGKGQELQMQKRLKAMEQQMQVLTEKDQENVKKQRVAEAAVDSMKQQMLELCRSDTLSRTRQQHDRDLAVIKEQHEVALLALQQKLDSASQALSEQAELGQKFREQVKKLESQREEEQLDRARIVNTLTQRLEESQQQCAKVLQTTSVQEMSQMQIQLQQAQSAKALSENMNKVLQDDLVDLKEQITLYESAVKHGVIAFDLSNDSENQLSESCMGLGLKKGKNGTLHRSALAHLSPQLPKDDALRLLQVEMQRCLGSLKGKRQKITQLQEELQRCRSRINEQQTQLEESKLSVIEKNQMNPVDVTAESQKESMKFQDDKRLLQEQVEVLEKTNIELKQKEEKLKAANSELCMKMREMIQELDQEKQEAAERTERVHQQYRDDVVNRVRTELMLEHDAQLEQLTAQHQQQLQELQTQLTQINDKLLAVQECYISVCKEKDMLEERMQGKGEEEEALVRVNEQKLKEERDAAMEKLRAELESRHDASVNLLKALWAQQKEAEIQKQVNAQVASAKAACKEKLLQVERTWTQRLEEARSEKHGEAAEVTCQTDEVAGSGVTVTAEELNARLSAQKEQLQAEANKIKCKAVEETRKQTQRQLHDKHLEDMATQVEGAVSRAYSRWIEDLVSLPEYQTSLQREREKWEELQEKCTEQRVLQAVREAEKRWLQKHNNQVHESRLEELQEEVEALQNRLEQVKREQAALLKAELGAARAVWNRDRQQENLALQLRGEQAHQGKLQEQLKKLRDEADRQKEELLLQMEVKQQETHRAREEEWKRLDTQRRQQTREQLMAELQSALAEAQMELIKDERSDQRCTEDTRRTSETSVTHVIQTSCRDLVNRAVTEAKKEWKRISEEQLSRVLKEAQEQNEREMEKRMISWSQKRDPSRCRKECAENLSKLQKKNQELQKHLEKACRQLQHSVREHKAAVERLKEEHDGSLQKAKEEYQQLLEEVKKVKESSTSDQQQSLQQGLEEMKQQYLTTVEKIRADMMRYLHESRERAAEMIRTEVQRERQDTARKMRRYYLTCLQELLEEGGNSTGAEKKIMNAARKLAAMAKVLETPTKSKSAKSYTLTHGSTAIYAAGFPPGKNSGSSKNQPVLPELPDFRAGVRSHREKACLDSEQKESAAAGTKPLFPASGNGAASEDAAMKLQTVALTLHLSDKPSPQTESPAQPSCSSASARSKSREQYLQGGDRHQDKPFLIQEAPVRDQKRTDWSLTSVDSDSSFHVPRLSYTGRKVEPVRPFSVSAASEFGAILSPDASDLTVYNDFAKTTPQTLSRNFAGATASSQRGPIPGSEATKQQDVCSRPTFSELKRQQQQQQDSGFHSPLYQQK